MTKLVPFFPAVRFSDMPACFSFLEQVRPNKESVQNRNNVVILFSRDL